MSEIELLGLIVGGVLAMFASVLSYLLYSSKKDKRDNSKKIDKLEKKIEELQTEIKKKDQDIIKAYQIHSLVAKTYDLMQKHYVAYHTTPKKQITKK